MRKYIRIAKVVLKNAYIRDSKIIGSVTSNLLISLSEIAITLTLFSAIFNNTKNLAGWNYYQIIFLYTLMKGITLINGLLARKGLADMAKKYVRTGEYDFYLTKPVNSMLLVSMSKPKIYNLLTLFFVAILAVYSLIRAQVPIMPISVVFFILLLIVGIILFYFINVVTIIPAFWFIRLYSLSDVINRISQVMRYPAGIYPFATKVILFTILPVLVVTYIPTWQLFNAPNYFYLLYAVVITIIFGFAANALWKFGEKHYGSASS
jgi:ABC-2 type transport system permease protein